MTPAASQFWVRWIGTIAPQAGEFDSTNPHMRAFLRALSLEFARHKVLDQPAVVCPGDGSISLASVVEAADSGDAVNKARAAFEEAILSAGGTANIPDGEDPSWNVKELIRLFEAQVRPLAVAA